MKQYREAVENALLTLPLLADAGEEPVTEAVERDPAEGLPPQPLRSAMHYSLLLPGKRLRPCLLLAAYHLIKEDWKSVIPFACALEMIHTYSLVHDDLPAMDDDALRRGKPTNHRVYGEDMAILAGDGLLNMAYETMLESPFAMEHPAEALRAMREIACRAGVRGMVAGQTLDVKLEGHVPSIESVRYIHLHKTADLLTAPIEAGFILAGADDAAVAAGCEYGKQLGLAFQMVDDLLDVEGDAATLGKTPGKDAAEGKLTWVAVRGIDHTRADAAAAVKKAVEALESVSGDTNFLKTLAQTTLNRVQ